MKRFALALLGACLLAAAPARGESAPDGAGLGIDPRKLSPVIDNPYVAFATLRSARYEGRELDPDSGRMTAVRVEVTVRDEPGTVAGVAVTVVEVADYEDGELVEKTKDYYAQDGTGFVYYMGEDVDDYEDGRVVGHGGAWLAGEKGSRVGRFMPPAPRLGDVFEQERSPGVAEDRSRVIATDRVVKVPAGTFEDCIEVEDFDPIGKTRQRKLYCPGVGLVREIFPGGGSIDLVERVAR